MTNNMAELLRHIDKIPIGWSGEKILKLKSATNGDIINWLRQLHTLCRDVKDLEFSLLNITSRSDRIPLQRLI
jgi:hypothetical protein